MNRQLRSTVLLPLFTALGMFSGALSASADDQAKVAKGPVKIFILSGQSNMTGRGTLGDKYPLVIEQVREAIARIKEIVPGYDEKQGYEIVGFCWNQGLSDTRVTEYADEYEENLTDLIKDLRKEFKAPDMKVVIGVTGNYGWDLADALKWHKTQEKKDEVAGRLW